MMLLEFYATPSTLSKATLTMYNVRTKVIQDASFMPGDDSLDNAGDNSNMTYDGTLITDH